MKNVTKLNVAFRHKRLVTAAEMYDQPEASDEMTWAMCEYVNRASFEESCQRCPKWEEDPDYGPCMRGCYAIAEEASRVAMVALMKFPPPTPDKSIRDTHIRRRKKKKS